MFGIFVLKAVKNESFKKIAYGALIQQKKWLACSGMIYDNFLFFFTCGTLRLFRLWRYDVLLANPIDLMHIRGTFRKIPHHPHGPVFELFEMRFDNWIEFVVGGLVFTDEDSGER